jgi:hypothetical protein
MAITVPLKKFEFFPDKPKRTTTSCLKRMDNGRHTAVSKLDGWNLFVCNEGENIEFWSRTWKPLPVADSLREAWLKLVKDGKIPDNSIINCEWMRMRAGVSGTNGAYDGPEMIYLLTPYAMEGMFVGFRPYKERREWLEGLGLPTDDLSIKESAKLEYELVLPAIAEEDFEKFFEKHSGVYRTEGIVICSNKGTLTANQNAPYKTKEMLKCKWREGSDGRTIV